MFGIGIGALGAVARISDLSAAIRALFANNEQGVWFDPSDFSTLFQDSAGTTPVTAVGQPVGRVLDKSGRGNHATQPTAASRPILQQDEFGKLYLAFDGVDDFLVTPSIDFTGTDKMTVLAGVRKNSDANTAMLLELSSNLNGFDGGFWILAPSDPGSPNFQWLSKGTVPVAINASGYAAPTSAVIAVRGDIAGDVSAIRVNGGTELTNSADQGTGKYGNLPLYIGLRGGTSLPFNGRLYSLVVRGAATADVSPAERYVNSKTGAY